MREIKFRGMPKFTDKDAFVYGWGCYTDENERFFIVVDQNQFIQVKEIEQYTGLHDKNGKEIYEGDVVKLKDKQGRGEKDSYEVVFNKGCFGYFKNKKWGTLDLWVDAIWTPNQKAENFIEVIGNIHENPGLIK